MLEELLDANPDHWRLHALLADAWRDQGRTDEAEAVFRRLLLDDAPGPRRATLLQHLGKTLFTAGRVAEAAACFRDALSLRRREGAPPDLIASSQLAVERCLETDRG